MGEGDATTSTASSTRTTATRNRLTRDVTATGGPTTLDEAYTLRQPRPAEQDEPRHACQRHDHRRQRDVHPQLEPRPLGNWNALSTDADGGGGGSATSQSRTHNGQNQSTAVGGIVDDVRRQRQPDQRRRPARRYTYDAWNRLVEVESGGSTTAVHEHDALNRQAQSGTTTPTDERWFSLQWQVLETRPSDGKTMQFVWCPVYVDAMVARDRDTDANGTLDERVYALHDANFDVTALVDTSGTVIDRFRYDRYGTFTVLDPDWATDADGVSDVAWAFYFQGFRFDTHGGGYDVRSRYDLTALGRPVQADPLGYPDGMSRYEWEKSNSQFYTDPQGLQAGPQYHHFYPLYLGGDINAPTFELSTAQHGAVHRYLASQGLPRGNAAAARTKWRSMTPEGRKRVIRESMRIAGFSEAMIKKYFADANKGNARRIAARLGLRGSRRTEST